MSKSPAAKKIGSGIRLLATNITLLGLILVLSEGVASYLLLGRDIMTTHSLAERRHTKYDPELGWVNQARVHIPDMYGRGVYLKTNSQGFRNNHDFDIAVPNGKYRIICSGDSFTFGYGVDNDHTWCQVLTSLDPRLETVNMGQGGYGVDQAYLWYKRDGVMLKHNLHLLAFITDDFRRMKTDSFGGYGKPVIELERGELVVKNVPVPRRAFILPWLTSITPHLRHLRSVELLERVSKRIGFVPNRTDLLSERMGNEKTQEMILGKMIEDLKRQNEKCSSTLALVYLPTLREVGSHEPEERLRFLQTKLRDLDIPFIDVLSMFRSLPYERALEMFIPPGQVDYAGAAGHLNNQGNEFVARVIYEGIKKELGEHRQAFPQ